MSANDTFGVRAANLTTPDELLRLEHAEDRSGQFVDIDALLADVTVRALRGERVVESTADRHGTAVSILELGDPEREILTTQFAVEIQHKRGSWSLPEKVSLKTGMANLPWVFATYPRYASGIVWEDKASVLPIFCPDAVWFWAVLQPLFEHLFSPFELRGRLSGTKNAEDQLVAWADVDEIVRALGLQIGDELEVMRYGAGWGALRATEQLAAKQRLLGALAAQASDELGARYRAYRLTPLVERYYAKAKGGRALRKSVVTKPLEKTLSGFFGGDWLAFLRYIGEEPHTNEEIATAIPATEIFVGSTKDARSVAADLGLPADEVQRALATFWTSTEDGPPAAISPVEERVEVLKAYWVQFDDIHARQAPGMQPLYGLVEFNRSGSMEPDWLDDRYSPRCYLELLTPELLGNVERLWGPTMLARWPDRIVTEISPHAALAEAFGPALRFWHEVALTAWYLAEGPYAVIDMAGLPDRHEAVLQALETIGCPVDPAMFPDLIEGEAQLGPQEPINKEEETFSTESGLSFTMSISSAMRRPGFEGLRDIVTRYRRAWAERFLDPYIMAQWDSELREAARHHSEEIAAKGKPPSPKQFARHAVAATNHWLGGDMSAFYAAIGEKSAIHPERVLLMPLDRTAFANRVFDALGGEHIERQIVVANREEGLAQGEAQGRHTQFVWLASQSLKVLQLEEAIGRVPELKEFGTPAFVGHSGVLTEDPDESWEHYVSVVHAVRQTR